MMIKQKINNNEIEGNDIFNRNLIKYYKKFFIITSLFKYLWGAMENMVYTTSIISNDMKRKIVNNN